MKIVAASFFAVMLISCSVATTGKEEQSRYRMVANLLSKFGTPTEPGIQYVVVDKDSSIFNGSTGLADINQSISLSTSHTMAAISMTKVLTAIAILQLVEYKKIKLEDKLSDYIEHPYDSDISIRQLLSHTAGLPDPIPLKWVHLLKNHDGFDEQAALTEILNENSESDQKAGVEYSYTNIGYWLLGKVIEKISRNTYSGYVTKNIFEVLELNPSEIGFLISDKNNHAKGYLKRWSLMNLFGRFFIDANMLGKYEGSWLRIKDVFLNGPSFGGAIGSATAFSKILQDLLSGQSKLLKEKTKKLLYSQQKINSSEKIDRALGWHIDKLNGITYYYKEGGGAGFYSEKRIYPDNGFASVIMTNKTSFNSRKILSELDMSIVVR